MADKRLQVFHTVANLLSFTKAAEILQMTQPAVTFQIRQLEETFNARLFDRSHNKINLTEAGRRMFEYSERLFDLYREMESSIRDVTGNVSGTLKLGATVAIGDYVLPKLLVAFKRDFPEVNIQLKLSHTAGIASMVENSSIDIGVIDTELDNKMIGTEKITYDEMVVVCSPDHSLSYIEQIDINQLISQPLILLEQGSGIHTDFSNYLTRQGLNYDKLNIIMELGSIEAIKNAVESGLGVSVLPKSTVMKDLETNRLTCLPLTPSFTNTLSFVYKKQKFQVLNVRELVEFSHKFYKTEEAARDQETEKELSADNNKW
ncbi:MAG: LysR family transcriptional regulator [Gammaproteobacteria bacterium]|nr:LysR family transcriptional regulator [Gammaproteobacteria bacterium]